MVECFTYRFPNSETVLEPLFGALGTLDMVLQERGTKMSLEDIAAMESRPTQYEHFNCQDVTGMADKLTYWSEQLAICLDEQGATKVVRNFCANNVWLVPLVRTALDIKNRNTEPSTG